MKLKNVNYVDAKPGIYKKDTTGVITIWEVRISDSGGHLDHPIVHAMEHTLSVFLKNQYGSYRIVGVYPSSCQKGFYVLTRFVSRQLIVDMLLEYIESLEMTLSVPIIGHCNNYKNYDLIGLKKLMRRYREVLILQGVALNYEKERLYVKE